MKEPIQGDLFGSEPRSRAVGRHLSLYGAGADDGVPRRAKGARPGEGGMDTGWGYGGVGERDVIWSVGPAKEVGSGGRGRPGEAPDPDDSAVSGTVAAGLKDKEVVMEAFGAGKPGGGAEKTSDVTEKPGDGAGEAEKVRRLYSVMDLGSLRRSLGLSQGELARELGMNQSQVSKLEKRADLKLSTVRRVVEALGGRLEIAADFGDAGGRVMLRFEGPGR